MMPELDGLKGTRRLRRELSDSERPRATALTARALRSDHKACLVVGEDGHLAEPVRLDALAGVLGRTARV